MINKTLLSTLLYVVFSCSCAFAEVKLYLSDQFQSYSPEQAFSLFEKMESEDPDKNILIYVHGRGRDVKDEWESLTQLEKNYNVRILMFDWPSWTSTFRRPVKNAEDSSVELFKIFNAVKKFKQDYGKDKTFTLLCHSMGNVVFSHFIKRYYVSGYHENDGQPLIENFIANAPDVAMRGHAEWLSKVDFVKRRFVLMNNRDFVLLASYILDIKERNPYFYKLGLGFQNLPLSDKKIQKMMDPDTTYIDFSYSLKNEHRYFQNKSEAIQDVLRQLINGEAFYPLMVRGKIKKKNKINFVYDKKDEKVVSTDYGTPF